MSNTMFQALSALALLAQLAALGVALFVTRSMSPVSLASAIVAGMVILYLVTRLGIILQSNDQRLMLLLAVEILVLAAACLALAGNPVAKIVAGVGFGLHLIGTALLALFAFTFTMRLF